MTFNVTAIYSDTGSWGPFEDIQPSQLYAVLKKYKECPAFVIEQKHGETSTFWAKYGDMMHPITHERHFDRLDHVRKIAGII